MYTEFFINMSRILIRKRAKFNVSNLFQVGLIEIEMVNIFLLQSHKVPKNINHIQGKFSFRGMILHNSKVDEFYF